MSTPNRPRLKSIPPTTTDPRPAEQRGPRPTVGAPKGVAEGVPTAVRPDSQAGDGRYAIAWLHICAPRGAMPTATSRCECGRDRSAVGLLKVLTLITDHKNHRDACPLRNPQEGRAAA
ncbi:hypothetical protein [Streptomyces venezuelae]|uniref:hypothetical protein n=1 Tax=Streptomyces venezuelae TaxID=54571 RepID=UPI001CC224B2|nr:hypothetical protein [Streptomyces venezuelae]